MGRLGVRGSQCTFWCSVLSDWLSADWRLAVRVSMHLLVLSAFRRFKRMVDLLLNRIVSMHLLVLSAFRPDMNNTTTCMSCCLNAPFGAQCFPTL